MPDGVRMQHKKASSMIVSARMSASRTGEAPRGAERRGFRAGQVRRASSTRRQEHRVRSLARARFMEETI
jgi:hypothetical protein